MDYKRFIKPKDSHLVMTDVDAMEFIKSCHRAEYFENPRVYEKAIRIALMALGFDQNWTFNYFHDLQDLVAKKYHWR